jgi:hypothetical protein
VFWWLDFNIVSLLVNNYFVKNKIFLFAGLVWVKNGHYSGDKWPWITCWFCGLLWRYGLFGHFIFTYLKNIYVYIQVYIAPIRARVARKNVTKMTKARKTLSSQHVIMVMCMTQKWPSNDHVYIQYASVNVTWQHVTKKTKIKIISY